MNLDKLDQVTLFNVAIMLDLPSLLHFCEYSDRINRLICNKKPIWIYRLNSEFPDWQEHFKNFSPKEAYFCIILMQ